MCEEGVVDRRGRVGDREGGGRRLHAGKGVGVGRGRAGEWRSHEMRRPPGTERAPERCSSGSVPARASGPGGSSAPARMSGSGGGFARESVRASVSEGVRVEC
jgi:hypothetical protein